MILIRNCPHSNGVYTYLSGDDSYIYKSSRTKSGINSLRKELDGNLWCRRRLGLSAKDVRYFESNAYFRLEIPFFEGICADFSKGLFCNFNAIKTGFALYESIWQDHESIFYPIHGDYSLGNILFGRNGSTIIDWEHFTENAAPWGFDLLNLLYESTFFSFGGKLTLPSKELDAFLSLKKFLNDLLTYRNSMKVTYPEFQNIVQQNLNIWGVLKNKLPALMLSKDQINYLESLP